MQERKLTTWVGAREGGHRNRDSHSSGARARTSCELDSMPFCNDDSAVDSRINDLLFVVSWTSDAAMKGNTSSKLSTYWYRYRPLASPHPSTRCTLATCIVLLYEHCRPTQVVCTRRQRSTGASAVISGNALSACSQQPSSIEGEVESTVFVPVTNGPRITVTVTRSPRSPILSVYRV